MRFEDIVYLQIQQIPYGHTMSYGHIARLAGYPNHARQVGHTLKQLPKETQLPWYRVVNSQGKISFPLNSDAYTRQREHLFNEGIPLINGKIPKPYCLGWVMDSIETH